jgi:hypothetical protein
MPREIATKCLAVRSREPPFAELSISGDDGERVYLLTVRQLRLLVKLGVEVLSRLEGHRHYDRDPDA